MELKPDCVRDVLKYIRDHTGVFLNEKHVMEYFEVRSKSLMTESTLTEKHQPDEIFYTTLQLLKAGMIEGRTTPGAPGEIISMTIFDVSWEGHEFLKSADSDVVWQKATTIAKALGSVTLQGLSMIAKHVFIQEIKARTGIDLSATS